MPLDRTHVTAASRIMLPTYAALHAMIGGLFLLQNPARTAGPAFAAHKYVTGGDIRLWGAVFLTLGLVEVVAMWVHRRALFLACLTAGAGLSGFWGAALAVQAALDPRVSWTSSLWVGGWVVCQAASARSLAVREVT